jgi:hypothetical protein
MNFSGMETVLLYFEYAYAQRYSQKDSLIVNISADCGETWTRVYANGPDGEGIFETAEPTTAFFEPVSSTDWCGSGYGADCPVIDLSNWAGQANIKIQFESYNKYGNNLYLNNMEVGSTVGIFDDVVGGEFFSLFPNPATKSVTIISPEKAGIQVLDLQGKVIISIEAASKRTRLDVQKLPKGIYIVQLSGKTFSGTKKLVIK